MATSRLFLAAVWDVLAKGGVLSPPHLQPLYYYVLLKPHLSWNRKDSKFKGLEFVFLRGEDNGEWLHMILL